MRIINAKKTAVLLLSAVLCFMLMGCTGKDSPDLSETISTSSTENVQTQESPSKNEAKETYMNFIGGNGTVTTSEAFKKTQDSYSLDYGTYSYKELKYAVSEEIMWDCTARYAFLDIDADGEEDLLVLRFENERNDLLNWTGIIRYDNGKLTLTYAYEDGYRIKGELFTSGGLFISGSSGAGVYYKTCVLLAKDGTHTPIYECYEYTGSFAPFVYYQLEKSQNTPPEDKYSNLSSDFCIKTYSGENTVKFYAEYSKDAQSEARTLEETFVNELLQTGIELIDSEEFDSYLEKGEKYRTKNVIWTDYADGLPPYYNAEVTACYPEEWWYKSNTQYEEAVLDTTQYAVSVAVETTKPVTDFQVVSLEISDYTESGLVCRTEALFSLPELTPEKPILIALSFPGDIPLYGVKFVDSFGNERLFTFSQSGLDGSLIFEEAQLAR